MAQKEKNENTFDIFEDKLAEITKKHGQGSIMSGNEILDIKRCSTGSLTLDVIMGGGYGLGKIVEAYGPESSGKTTMAITGAIEAQKAFPDKHVVIIDAEHALDRNYCKKLGLDMSKVFISQPECGEQGLDILEDLISTGRVSFAIVDSVATLIPKSELDGEITDSSMGTQARLMSKACRKLVGIVNKTGTILFFTNQLRSKIGVVYGSPEVTSGGNALKFYASTRLDIRKTAGDKDGDEIKNIKVTIKTVKNKLAPPFRKCELFINFGEGVDKVSEVLSVAIHTDLIIKTGNTYSYRGSKLGVGLGQAKQMLKDNPEICDEIEALVRKSIADLADLDIVASDELVS